VTLETLIGYTADQWDKLSQEELQVWAKQYFTVTRPELQEKETPTMKAAMKDRGTNGPAKKFGSKSDVDKALQQAEFLRKTLGI